MVHYTDFVMTYMFQGRKLTEAVERSFIRNDQTEFLANSGIAVFTRSEKGKFVSICLNKSQRMSMPWGIPMPTCPYGCREGNVIASAKKLMQNRQVKADELLDYRFLCQQCDRRTRYIPPPSYVTTSSMNGRYTWSPFPQEPPEVEFRSSEEILKQKTPLSEEGSGVDLLK